MSSKWVRASLRDLLVVISLGAVLAGSSFGQAKEQVLYTFTYHADGGMPYAGVTFDAKGNLYGVTYLAGLFSGAVCCGGVFQMTPNGTGGWTYDVIHTFTGPVTDGEAPSGSVIFDASGNLYGTTQNGDWCGVAYELSPTPGGLN